MKRGAGYSFPVVRDRPAPCTAVFRGPGWARGQGPGASLPPSLGLVEWVTLPPILGNLRASRPCKPATIVRCWHCRRRPDWRRAPRHTGLSASDRCSGRSWRGVDPGHLGRGCAQSSAVTFPSPSERGWRRTRPFGGRRLFGCGIRIAALVTAYGSATLRLPPTLRGRVF